MPPSCTYAKGGICKFIKNTIKLQIIYKNGYMLQNFVLFSLTKRQKCDIIHFGGRDYEKIQ